jgi:predicted 3-demethylubiquinone-9 3-methyltransferase (glyoxalase superfamily)
MQTITPMLWFDNNAEQAVDFYASIFPQTKIGTIVRYSEAGPGPTGSVMTIAFELNGQEFVALNGGPIYKFTPAVSFVVHCETQDEIDMYWDKLSAGGTPNVCGWLQDKFGLSWQIVPNALLRMIEDSDKERANRVIQAMLKMTKLDIGALQAARDAA